MMTRRTYPRHSARIPLWAALVASLVGMPAMVVLLAVFTPATPEVSDGPAHRCEVEQVRFEVGDDPVPAQPNRSI